MLSTTTERREFLQVKEGRESWGRALGAWTGTYKPSFTDTQKDPTHAV